MRKYSMIFLFAFLYCTSCKKNERSQTDTTDTINRMTGRIVWPANLNLDTTGVKVSTFHSAASIKENGFIVDTINKFSTVFLTDSKGDVKMMRYNYPGQKDNDISINSTALALIMNAPIVTSLSDEGQLAMINKIQLDSNFPSLVDEVKNAITLNKSIIDTTNTSLILATSKLFESASRYKLNTYRPVPLNIKTANPGTFSFANNNVSHKYVIGIYKNNSRIEKLIVNGTQSFAASFKDVIDGVFGNGYSSPDSKIFSTAEDGTLEFRIRSGAPGTDDNSTEYKEAFKENIVEYIFTLVKSKMPLDSKCTKNAYDGIKSTIESTQAFSKANTPADFASIALGFCSDLFNTRASLFEDCSNYKDPNYKNPYWIAVGKFFKFFDKVGKVGQGLNIGMHVYDLYNSRAAIDTCFSVFDKKVVECRYDTLALLRSKTWKLVNGPKIYHEGYESASNNCKRSVNVFKLKEAELSFKLENGITKVYETLIGNKYDYTVNSLCEASYIEQPLSQSEVKTEISRVQNSVIEISMIPTIFIFGYPPFFLINGPTQILYISNTRLELRGIGGFVDNVFVFE